MKAETEPAVTRLIEALLGLDKLSPEQVKAAVARIRERLVKEGVLE